MKTPQNKNDISFAQLCEPEIRELFREIVLSEYTMKKKKKKPVKPKY